MNRGAGAETITEEAALSALATIQGPDLWRDIVSLGFVNGVRIDGGTVAFTIELTTPACPVRDQMKEQAHRAVLSLPGVKAVDLTMTSQVRATRSEQKDKLLPLVKNIVPIASGKGGVGKSTVSANLAVALVKLGARVGLMDADVYGPTIPILMGAGTPPAQRTPAVSYGVKIMSMGFYGEATIWRGPMLSKVVDQFLGGVEWGELDYLLVDLPPGTGDAIVLLDVRQEWETTLCRLENAVHIPIEEIEHRTEELNPEDEIVVYCHVGQRSAAVAEYLTQLGFKNAKNLLGGLDYWAQTVDPAMRRY